MSAIRKAAARAIAAIDNGAQAQAALEDTGLSGPERAVCSDLVYGLLRSRIRVRHELGRVMANPKKLPPRIRVTLELATYALLFQDGAKDYAVVNETVKSVRKLAGQTMANVANASLRTLLALPLKPEPAESDIDALATYYSLPASLSRRWNAAYGQADAVSLARRSFARPWGALRVNATFPNAANLIQELAKSPDAVAIDAFGFAFPPGKTPKEIAGKNLRHLHEIGAISWQAAGSQRLLTELGVFTDWTGERIWDACAGFGGKTCAMLERALNVVLASDINRGRLAGLVGDCARLGLTPPTMVAIDARSPVISQWRGHILVDAPCSGTGVLARRPDIREKFTEENTKRLIETQREILTSLVSVLAPGKELLYATCALNPDENQKQSQWLLSQNPGLELVCEWQTPHEHEWLEGMYGARFRKAM